MPSVLLACPYKRWFRNITPHPHLQSSASRSSMHGSCCCQQSPSDYTSSLADVPHSHKASSWVTCLQACDPGIDSHQYLQGGVLALLIHHDPDQSGIIAGTDCLCDQPIGHIPKAANRHQSNCKVDRLVQPGTLSSLPMLRACCACCTGVATQMNTHTRLCVCLH